MAHTSDAGDADGNDHRGSPRVTTAAETLVVPLGLVLDVATSLSSSRR